MVISLPESMMPFRPPVIVIGPLLPPAPPAPPAPPTPPAPRTGAAAAGSANAIAYAVADKVLLTQATAAAGGNNICAGKSNLPARSDCYRTTVAAGAGLTSGTTGAPALVAGAGKSDAALSAAAAYVAL
jgi:hypothetical protein